MTRVAIYNGRGASPTGAALLRQTFAEALHPFGAEIRTLSHDDMTAPGHGWIRSADALVIGGGAYGEMKAALGPSGLRAVHDFAQENITIGICMGAYGLSSAIEFSGEGVTKKTSGMNVFNGIARGSLPLTPAPYNGHSNSARILALRHESTGLSFPSLYWGGPAFAMRDEEGKTVTPLATLTTGQGQLVLGLGVDHKAGGRSVLAGYHSEAVRPRDLRAWLEKFKSDDLDMYRLHGEIAAHASGKYYMGFAALLDDSRIVPGHSFVKDILTPPRARCVTTPMTIVAP